MLSMRDAIRDLAEDTIDSCTRKQLLAELAIAINHEVRNPLTAVKGFLQLFSGSASYPPEHKELFCLMISELDDVVHSCGELLGSTASPAGWSAASLDKQ